MDTMRKMMLLACGLAACICVMNTRVTARVGPGARVEKASGGGVAVPLETLLLDPDPMANIYPLPPGRKVIRHVFGGSARESAGAEDQLIYSNVGDPQGQQSFVYRPSYEALQIADDIWSDAVDACEITKFQIRVNGGVREDRAARFDVTVALSRTCPSGHPLTDQDLIAGTEITFSGLSANINIDHDVVVDYNDPFMGICSDGGGCNLLTAPCMDGSSCVPRGPDNPLIADPQVWLRVYFSNITNFEPDSPERPGWLVGWPPVTGFSTDMYDHRTSECNTWFGGYPGLPHASFYAQFYAPESCPTHFLAYLAMNVVKPYYVDQRCGGTTKDQLMADDIELIVDDCELSAIYVGTHGTNGQYEMDFDVRVTPFDNPLPNTERHWVSDSRSGNNNMELARLDFSDPDEVVRPGRDFWITWQANKENTGVINVTRNQAGGQSLVQLPDGRWVPRNRLFGLYDTSCGNDDQWIIDAFSSDGKPAVFFFAVYCRGEAPRGPCCMAQFDLPDMVPACSDDIPVTSCLEGRWLNDGSDGECEDGRSCDFREQDCPNESCVANHDCWCEAKTVCPTEFNTGLCSLGQCEFGQCDLGTCEDGTVCGSDQDCPGSSCAAGSDCTCNPVVCSSSVPCPDTSCVAGSDCTCNPLLCGSSVPCPDTSCEAGSGCTCNWVCDTTDEDACPGASRCIEDDPWARIGQPPCGTHACCKPDSNCEDLPRDDCVAILDTETGNPSRWNRGDFCGVNDQRCPWFACYDAPFACTACINAFIECGISDPPGACAERTGWDESECNLTESTCTIPKGCNDVWCCDTICQENNFCCTEGWDCGCASRTGSCTGPPANNACYDPEPGFGATEIILQPAGAPLNFKGNMKTKHTYAEIMPGDPRICCLSNGIVQKMPATVWYKFRAKEDGSVRVTTCETAGAGDARDSVIQVFHAPLANIGLCDDGSQCSVEDQNCPPSTCAEPPCTCKLNEQALCRDLEVKACNDDIGCGVDGRLSDVCVPNVEAGDYYYVVVGVGTADEANQRGEYKLTVSQPCDDEDIPPMGSLCETAPEAFASPPTDFDLEGATLSCPTEVCLVNQDGWNTMTSDLWYYHRPLTVEGAPCTGELFITTCDTDPTTPEGDTTLAVYDGTDCPPEPTDLSGYPIPLDCNDDAPASAEITELLGMPQNCAGTGAVCDEDADCAHICELGRCAIGACSNNSSPCTADADCSEPATCDHDVCEDGGDCVNGEGLCTVPTCSNDPDRSCTLDSDCNAGTCARAECTNHGACALGVCDICTRVVCTIDDHCDIGRCGTGDGSEGEWCSVLGNDCESGFLCHRAGECAAGTCESACWPGSLVKTEVSANSYYTVRVGGSAGAVPFGQLRFMCIDHDCNGNSIIDHEDIENCPRACSNDPQTACTRDLDCDNFATCEVATPWCGDCNNNGLPDLCDIYFDPENWADCQPNGIPDKCEIPVSASCPADEDYGCTAGPAYCEDANENCAPDDCDCPAGTPDWAQSVPPSGIIDARQPHPLDDGSTPWGIDEVIVVSGPSGAPDECFELCEMRVDGTANFISNVIEDVDDPPGTSTYTITLGRPLAAGVETYITYTSDWPGSPPSSGVYISLPADSNADGQSQATDIADLMSCCVTASCSPHGDYSCDINHSGTVTGEDVLRLIDLLNGGNAFDVWEEQVPYRPSDECTDNHLPCTSNANCNAPATCEPVCP